MLITGIICAGFVVIGICGILGVEKIHSKYSDQSWGKEYKQKIGISWILLGVCWFLMFLLTEKIELNWMVEMLMKVASVLPAVIYLSIVEKKYKDRYNSGQ